jgi:endonuclease/exonuclease/phosphatase family metal-dependent hydrolase
MLRRLGDHWWPTTVFMFGPRWLLGLPLLVLVPLAATFRPRLLLLLVVAAVALLVLVLGFNLPFRRPSIPEEGAPRFRLMTWNVGGQGESDPTLAVRIASQLGAQVVVLQECGRMHVDAAPGWHIHHDLGMCLLSQLPIRRAEGLPRDDVWRMGGSGAIVSYELEAPGGPFALTNVHLETPREGLEAIRWRRWEGVDELEKKNVHRRLEARMAREWVDAWSSLPRVVAGDFNMTDESAVFREAWGDFNDAFVEAGVGFGYTKRTRLLGVRIDHVLVDRSWRVLRAELGPKRVDHRPFVVDLARAAP